MDERLHDPDVYIASPDPMSGHRRCRWPGCTLTGKVSGYCKKHYTTMWHRGTSDGRHGGSRPKLTVSQLAEAKRMRSAFKSTKEIARHFGVALGTMQNYLKGRQQPAPDPAPELPFVDPVPPVVTSQAPGTDDWSDYLGFFKRGARR